ncbi:inositol monophosphatase family protein [Persicirhabdus sediminis]|uniref:Inositol-1-monophosphatase n=1 Tax=Persicirhabdus sediminis TaxID=454144 RepID=A0A8J7MF77_9BACT|nr:inositol monophosphatase [Persicirhabdus sediminis]MBK1792306.1 inositol monophosphatase [Persicirhabdus sediminis]
MQISSDLMNACGQLMRRVGEFQMQHFRAMPAGSSSSKSLRETVSFVDVESERMLIDGLTPLVDGAGFFGEESGQSGSQQLVWIIDPLDGTTNFLSGLDHFSISVALVSDGQPLLGLVFKPYTGDLYSAMRGQGAYFNGKLQQLAQPDLPINEALFMTGFPYRSADLAESFFQTAPEVLTLGLGIRRSGSAALDLANLGMGWIQGFWESDLQPYDCAAGLLIMEENGIVCFNAAGQPFDMMKDRIIVAGLTNVQPALLDIVARHYGDA